MKELLKRLRRHYKAIEYSVRVCKVLLANHKYFASVKSGEIRDLDGGYLPWFTYPASEALKNWDLSGKRVFEYGSGYSTLFWASRAKEVVSIEHNPDWYEKISSLAPRNARLVLAAITQREDEYHPTPDTRVQFEQYADTIKDFGVFDVIVIDGYAKSRVRYQCARAALGQLASNGLIILDNSDWLPATALFLRKSGLIEIDLSGPVPGNRDYQTTSFFFSREFNFPPAGNRQPLSPVGGRIDNWESALEQEINNGSAALENREGL